MNQYRLNIVHQAFSCLDKNQSNTLEYEEVRRCFDASRHPDAQVGTRSVEDCQNEFNDMFSMHHQVESNFQQPSE